MSALPSTKDVRQARKQVDATAHTAFETVKNPLFAAIGAVDTATKAVTQGFSKASGRAEEAQTRLQKALNDLQSKAGELPKELNELRNRLEPAELRKVADAYTEAAQKAYGSLIERGEDVYGEIRKQPRVKQALSSVESGVDTAQGRLEAVVKDLNHAVDDLRGRFARGSRSVGEKTARGTERVAAATAKQVEESANEVADAVTEAGHETASTTRSTTRQAANRAAPPAPPRKPTSKRPGDNSKKS
jgi:heparin binding hemagglutinin HbhA